VAEEVRFELTVTTIRHDGFQDRCLNPLSHSSVKKLAVSIGFEPMVGFYPHNALAKRRYRPLSQLTVTRKNPKS
jgi:hypothetical protein